MSTAIDTTPVQTREDGSGHLSARALSIVRALARVFLPPDDREEGKIDHVARYVDGWVPYLPALFRMTFPMGLFLIQWGAVLTFRSTRPFTRMEPDARATYLHGWTTSRFALFRTLVAGVRGLVLSAYYSLPDVHARIGYDPESWVEECKARRQRWLDEEQAPDVSSSMEIRWNRSPEDLQ